METLLIIAGAFVLGGLHALDADHVATVSSLILERQPLGRTLRLALRWSLGHSITLLVLALLAIPMRTLLTNENLAVMDRVVGASMIVLGSWLCVRQWRHSRRPEIHLSRSGWMLFGMGVLHGTAGWSALVLMVPVALLGSPVGVLAYIAVFSLGMILTMSLYAVLVNRATWINRIGAHLGKIRYISAAVTLTIGWRLMVGLP